MASTVQTEPRRLTADQVAQYHRDGYLIVQGLYTGEQMLAWKQLLQDVLQAEAKAAGHDKWNMAFTSGVRVWNTQQMHPTLREAMRDEHVTPILQQIIGPDVEFLSGKAVFKNATTDFASPWHQDWFYWEGATKTSVWIALDDATPENGCLMFIAGTHKKVFPKTVFNGNAFVNRVDDKHLEGLPRATIEVKRGDAVFFHDLAMHSSHPNTAKKDRWSFISTYRNAGVKDEGAADGVNELWKKPLLLCGRSVNGGERQ